MIYQRFIPEGWNQENKEFSIDELKKAKNNDAILEAEIKSIDNNRNVHIDLGNNIQGIIPKEELGQMINGNNFVQFKVNSINEQERKCYLSRKAVKDESMSWVINDLSKGDIVEGIVRNIKPYGAFVEIGGGTTGLLYINDISVGRMRSPEEKLSIGQRLKVKIKDIDKENKKFYLSYKEMLGTWEENIKGIQEGNIVKGVVKEATKNKDGIFIELKPNLIGMCEYNDKVQYGQEVDVRVKRIIPDKKKIKLILVSC